ncbi:hypothetical protein HDU96_010277 [Phlyctochytrium bullatum]|nr:hypothetical protein HDU96_010277 [Phlyctochytrium bullatum]
MSSGSSLPPPSTDPPSPSPSSLYNTFSHPTYPPLPRSQPAPTMLPRTKNHAIIRLSLLLLGSVVCLATLSFLSTLHPSAPSTPPPPLTPPHLHTARLGKVTIKLPTCSGPAVVVGPTNATRPRLVASLTSFGPRLANATDTLVSLWEQKERFDACYLHVPDRVKRLEMVGAVPVESGDGGEAGQVVEDGVPENIRELEERFGGWLRVCRGEDYGPSTKLIGTLLMETDPNTIIVTGKPHHLPKLTSPKVDDDMSYHRLLSTVLLHASQAHPFHAPCFKCELWGGNEGKTWKYLESEGECHGWGDAWTGIAYRRGWFDDSVVTGYEGRPEGCWIHDDVYISGWLLEKRDIRPWKVAEPGWSSVVSHKDHTKLSIHRVPEGYKRYRDPCIEHFGYFKGAGA